MTEIEKKIEKLKKKISVRETRIEKSTKKITDEKSVIKTAKNEIEEFRFEIKQLELEQLSETLSQNGFTAADIAAAIASGEIKRSQSDKLLSDNNSAPVQYGGKNADDKDKNEEGLTNGN